MSTIGTRCNHCVNFTSAKCRNFRTFQQIKHGTERYGVTGGDGEMDGQSVRLTEASFNAFAASMQTNIFIAIFILVAFSFLRFRFSHVYAPC